jgi:hypothetical protein
MNVTVSWRCYLFPAAAAILFLLLTLPPLSTIFAQWIPNLYINAAVKALLLMALLFLLCAGNRA